MVYNDLFGILNISNCSHLLWQTSYLFSLPGYYITYMRKTQHWWIIISKEKNKRRLICVLANNQAGIKGAKMTM